MGKGLDDIPMADFPEILLARHGNNNHKTPVKELYKAQQKAAVMMRWHVLPGHGSVTDYRLKIVLRMPGYGTQ